MTTIECPGDAQTSPGVLTTSIKGGEMAKPTETERFWSKVDKTGDCWLWTGSLSPDGYGLFPLSREHRPVRAHRYSYELHVGPIPAGLTIDHVLARGCVHRNCVNPAHLEAVTAAENTRRGRSPFMDLHRAGVCARGHSAEEHANRLPNGWVRYCRACRREDRKAARESLSARRADELFARCSGGNRLHLAGTATHALCGAPIFDAIAARDVSEEERLCGRCWRDPEERDMAEALLAEARAAAEYEARREATP